MGNVYRLRHRRVVEVSSDNEEIYSTILIGFFSSEQKCEEIIKNYIQKPGFSDFKDDFEIDAVYADVDDFNSSAGDFKTSVFYLAHEADDGVYDTVTDLGFYSTEENAQRAMDSYKKYECFAKLSDGFSVDEYKIDIPEWEEGFFVY